MNKYISPFFQIIGSSLKILPAAVWDELHIFLTSFYKIKSPTNLSLQLLLFWQIYMILSAILNGYAESITFFRYGLVFIGLILLKNYYRSLISKISKNIIIVIGLSYLGICIALYLFGISFGLSVAWWQDTLWVGTAYSGFVIFIILSITLLNSFTQNQRLIFLALGYASGVAMDSRLVFILITTLLPFAFNGRRKNKKTNLFNSVKSLITFIFIIFSLTTLFNLYSQEITTVFKSAQNTIIELTTESNTTERDSDRQANIRAVGSLMNDDPFKFLFGSGLTSHQYELSAYLNKSADDKIRPSGVPAVVFDGGIIYLIIIFACGLNSILQFLSYYLNNLISLRSLFIWIVVIINSLLVLFITNTTDLMLWWAVILSGHIFNKKFMIDFKKNRL